MKKSTKGAIAAAAAGVLLLGGAGTLAYWNDSGTVTGTTITSGKLVLDDSACGDAAWMLDGNVAYNEATDKLIPGDSLSKTCDLVIESEGTHFTDADLAVTIPTASGSADWLAELTPTISVGGQTATGTDTTVPLDGDGLTNVTATITITWPYMSAEDEGGTDGLDNDLNDAATGYTIDDITVVVSQDHLTETD